MYRKIKVSVGVVPMLLAENRIPNTFCPHSSQKFRKMYQIYPGKAELTDGPLESLNETIDLIRVTGWEIASDRGDSLKEYFQ
jgi:hypothetical protein